MMTAPARSHHKAAAIAYFVYGMVYLVGAVLELDPSRKVVFWGFVPWWSFYVAGGLILTTLPFFILKGIRWLIRLLTFFVSGKCLWLVWLQGRNLRDTGSIDPYNTFFALVAGIAALLLLRAALSPKVSPATSE